MSWLHKLKKSKPIAKQRESLLRIRHEIEEIHLSEKTRRELEVLFEKKTA